MREYKALTPEQVKKYRGMTVEQLEEKLKEYKTYKNLRYKDVKLGEPFWVVNGQFKANLKKIGDKVYSIVYVEDALNRKDSEIVRDRTKLYNRNEELGLEIRYIKDDQEKYEIWKIKRDKELDPVMGGKQECDHEYESVTYDGLTCIKCGGWYCL